MIKIKTTGYFERMAQTVESALFTVLCRTEVTVL
jgi:hypothetical protein